jgi:ribulose 1,5-bisphosphate synthetase/thiazole synthase
VKNVIQQHENISLIAEADVAVIGGSMAGIASALRFAQSGKSVIILEQRTYMGREFTATLRPWVRIGNDKRSLPDWLKLILQECQTGEASVGKSIPMHPDRFKIALEDLLLQKGIRFLYATLPIELLTSNGQLDGVIVANKSGRQAVLCKTIIDATETALISHLAGADVSPKEDEGIYFRTLEFDGVEKLDGKEMKVPKSFGIENDQVTFHQGVRGKAHVYVEFALCLTAGNHLHADRERETKGRRIGMELASYLIQNMDSFGKANLAASSFELYGPFASAKKAAPANGNISMSHWKTPVSQVWSLYRDFYINSNEAWLDPLEAARMGDDAARLVMTSGVMISSIEGDTDEISQRNFTDQAKESKLDYEVRIPSQIIGSNGNERFVPVPPVCYPVLNSVDVLVVGGGSSGANASIQAAKEGVHTMLIDANPGMGGTGTFGGVDSYWFGRRIGYATKITKKVKEVQDLLRYKGNKWNIEAKMFALLDESLKAGTEHLFNTITFGAVTKKNRVCGSIVATRWGAFCILSKVLIDATGDGDVAAFAGADYVYGSKMDQTVMWYSLAQFMEPGKTKNNFTSMVHIGDVEDLTRAIITGRRRAVVPLHEHGIYVATRESRHIVGEVTMTLPDQLLHRLWDDVINIHFSNHDVKGVSGADWVNVGLLPPNLNIEIPYRMLLPQGLEGILLAGKAISATHDALPAIRMQSDLENLGGVVALAAAFSVKNDEMPRELDIKILQKRLIQEGLLPENILYRKLMPLIYSDEELTELVDRIEEQPLYEYSNMRMNEVFMEHIPFAEICCVGSRVIPVLEKALQTNKGTKQIRIAQALAMYESNIGVPVLIDAIMEALQGDSLPKRTAEIMYVTQPPDHGAMPDVAYLLYSLAQTKDKRSIQVWNRVTELINPTEEEFKDAYLGLYYYIDALCKGTERLGDPDAVPAVLKLHEVTYLSGQQYSFGPQPDYFLERRAMLELSIGRALARCGEYKGYEILNEYLSDARSLLKQQAHTELIRLTGENLPLQQQMWQKWLENNREVIKPCPQQMRLDMENNSESILRCVSE